MRTRSCGRRRAAIARLASSTSATLIWAKSFWRSTSLPDTVRLASISISGFSCLVTRSLAPSNIASAARSSPARFFSGLDGRGGAVGENIAIIFSMSSRERQNSRNASLKTASSSCRETSTACRVQ